MSRTLVIAFALGALAGGQTEQPQTLPDPPYIGFRVDDNRLIAMIKVDIQPSLPELRAGLSAPPAARFGYQYIDPPPGWHEALVDRARALGLRTVHAAPGHTFTADIDRVVVGNHQCSDAIGVLLRVTPDRSSEFAALSTKYFLVDAATRSSVDPGTASRVSIAPRPVLADDVRRALESKLNQLLARELPRVQQEAGDELVRHAANPVDYHQKWARERREVDDALAGGRGRLSYDVQAFSLSPDKTPVYFVRAYWMVGARQGFAASLWLRGQALEMIWTNLRPASWLRMFEFQGKVDNEQLGLVLNVFDQDGDGWGEILFAHGGYEAMTLQLLKYSASGLDPAGLDYAHGC
jgi:hypothetical protein